MLKLATTIKTVYARFHGSRMRSAAGTVTLIVEPSTGNMRVFISAFITPGRT